MWAASATEIARAIAVSARRLRGGLRDGGAGTQAADHRHVIARPILFGLARINIQRNPELRFRRGKSEIRRHDADHLVAGAFQCDPTADDVGVAREFLLPQRVAQNHEAVLSGDVFSGTQSSAEFGTGAENRK